MLSPHSSVLKPRTLTSPSLKSWVCLCVFCAVKENLPLADLGPFGLPAAAMIVTNAIAKLVLGWKSSGAGWPRPDLAEGAFHPPPEGLGLRLRLRHGVRGAGGRSGGTGFAPGPGRNGVRAGLPRGGDRAPLQPVSPRAGAVHSRFPSSAHSQRCPPPRPPAASRNLGLASSAAAPWPSQPPSAGRLRLGAPRWAEPQFWGSGAAGWAGPGRETEPRPPGEATLLP